MLNTPDTTAMGSSFPSASTWSSTASLRASRTWPSRASLCSTNHRKTRRSSCHRLLAMWALDTAKPSLAAASRYHILTRFRADAKSVPAMAPCSCLAIAEVASRRRSLQ